MVGMPKEEEEDDSEGSLKKRCKHRAAKECQTTRTEQARREKTPTATMDLKADKFCDFISGDSSED